jgi:outer membrane immunogenic protein
MKKILLATLAVTALAGSALAADLPRPYYKAPPPIPVWSWSGFYIGVNAGYSFGQNDISQSLASAAVVATSVTNSNITPRGGFGGGQVGFNWQTGAWVWGVEADIQGASQSNTGCGPLICFNETVAGAVITQAATVYQKETWFATARGRVGWAGWADGGWLWYVTGGGAWAGFNETDTFTATMNGAGNNNAASFSYTRSGWALGGGVETHLWAGWTAKVEFLHLDLSGNTNALFIPAPFGPAALLTTTNRFRDDIIRAGINYKFDWGYYPAPAIYK